MLSNKQKNFIYKYLIEHDCELISNLNNIESYDSIIKFICKCKLLEDSITFKKYYRSKYKCCINCNNKSNISKIKNFNEHKIYFENHGCKLLLTIDDYINNNKKISFLCKCGKIENNMSISLFKVNKYKSCKSCFDADKVRLSYNFNTIKENFEKNNLTLLTSEKEYISVAKTRLSYVCKCGVIINDISYNSFILSKYKCCNKCVLSIVRNNYYKKHGVYTPMHNCDVLNKLIKNSYKSKKYILPSKKTILLQGYENLALDILLKTYKEDDLITDLQNIPKINYEYNKKSHIYIPDIYIKSANKIIEIKSEYTYKSLLLKNICKALYSRKNNYDYEFWIFYKVKKTNTPNIKYKNSYLKYYII
jgi:hypothetical protein